MKNIITKVIGLLLNIGAYIVPSYVAKKGFELFCTPFRIKLKPKQEEFLETAERESFTGDEIPTIQVYKWGTGTKKVLFVHGWQSHSFRWIKYIFAFQKKDYTIYAIDGPANGHSGGKIMNVPLYSQVINEFTKQYGEMDLYVGHSIGAFTLAYTFYKSASYQPKAFVALACPGNAQDFVDTYSGMLSLNKKAIGLVTEYFKAQYDQPPSYFNMSVFSKGLSMPGLVVHDKTDKEAPFHYAEQLAENWTGSESFYTEGLGHKLRSPEVVDRVLEFSEEKLGPT